MKIKIALIVALIFFSNQLFSQNVSQTVRKQSYRINLKNRIICYKESKDRISEKEFHKLIMANPRLVLEPVIDEYGTVEVFLVDTLRTDNKFRLDLSKRVKEGERFPPFYMKSITNKFIDSRKLNDKLILIRFDLPFMQPYNKGSNRSDFGELVAELQEIANIEAIIITESTRKEVSLEIGGSGNSYSAEIVPNGKYFSHRYLVVQFPSMILVGKNGRLISYYDNNDFVRLKSDIKKLKLASDRQHYDLRIPSRFICSNWHGMMYEDDRLSLQVGNNNYSLSNSGLLEINNKIEIQLLPEQYYMDDGASLLEDDDAIYVFLEYSVGDGGSSVLKKVNVSEAKVEWEVPILGFNMGLPVIDQNFAYVTAIGSIGKINLDLGKYEWKHNRLYDNKKSSFNHFDTILIHKNQVTFISTNRSPKNRGKTVVDKIVVDKRSGEILEIIK